jgi:hypothetical protein
MTDETRILNAIEPGDRQAARELRQLVYEELRQLAARKLARERTGRTLNATALVHEAYVRLVDKKDAQAWDHRGHFFAAAAEALGMSLATAERQWAYAHTWLFAELEEDEKASARENS